MVTKTATAEKTETAATPAVHNKSRQRRVPVKATETPQVPTPAAVPRKNAKANGNHTAEKKAKVTIESHFIPGKVAMATMTPDKLKELAFISTYSAKDDQSTSPRKNGYQREPMEARFPGIGRYYARDNNRHLITPLIASARVYNPKDQARFNQLFAKGDIAAIHKEFGKNVFSIVDGQHRMGGLFWAWNHIADFNADVPIMVYYGLHYTEEANLFDDVNTNQRKLPKALIEATKVHMEAGEKSHEQFIREVAASLAQDGDSVWHGLVNMTGGPEGKGKPVTYEGLRRSTGNMFNVRLVSRLQDRKLRVDKVAKRYWEMVSKACAVAWDEHPREVIDDEGFIVNEPVKYKLKDLAGMAAVARLGQDVINSALEKGATEEDFNSAMADLVSRLGQVDWEKSPDNPWVATSAGHAGASGLYTMLYQLVYLDRSPGDPVEPDDGS
jgi:DGQHR domain-containing protein